MYKYKKIISPILMIVITLVMIFVIFGITFLHSSSINTLKNVFEDVKYSDEIELYIRKSLQTYMSDNEIEELLKNNRVKNNINLLLNSIERGSIKEKEQYLKVEFKEDVLNIVDDLNVNEASVNEYEQKISKVYFGSLLPTTEFNLIHNVILKVKELVIFGIIISVICLILCIIYLFNAGKQNKWLFVSIYNVIIICIVIIVILSNLTGIYYSNSAVTSVLQGVISNIIIDVLIIGIILLILSIVLNYIVYFKKEKKH